MFIDCPKLWEERGIPFDKILLSSCLYLNLQVFLEFDFNKEYSNVRYCRVKLN